MASRRGSPRPISGTLDFRIVPLEGGDRVFLWWSEAQGEHGLAGRGVCVSIDPALGPLHADVEPITLAYCDFGRAQLRPFRDAPGASPKVTLATKLYAHAHNKVVSISAREEGFLDAVINRAIPR